MSRVAHLSYMEYESPWFFQGETFNFSNMPSQDGASFGFTYLVSNTRLGLVDSDTILKAINTKPRLT